MHPQLRIPFSNKQQTPKWKKYLHCQLWNLIDPVLCWTITIVTKVSKVCKQEKVLVSILNSLKYGNLFLVSKKDLRYH